MCVLDVAKSMFFLALLKETAKKRVRMRRKATCSIFFSLCFASSLPSPFSHSFTGFWSFFLLPRHPLCSPWPQLWDCRLQRAADLAAPEGPGWPQGRFLQRDLQGVPGGLGGAVCALRGQRAVRATPGGADREPCAGLQPASPCALHLRDPGRQPGDWAELGSAPLCHHQC